MQALETRLAAVRKGLRTLDLRYYSVGDAVLQALRAAHASRLG